MMIPGFLVGRLAGPIASGVALVLAVALGVVVLSKNGTINALRDEIHNPKTGYIVRLQAAERDLTQCQANRITLEEAARRQNVAVEAAKAEGQRQNAELDRIAADYRKQLGQAQSEISSILGRQGSGNHCADAERLIREMVQ